MKQIEFFAANKTIPFYLVFFCFFFLQIAESVFVYFCCNPVEPARTVRRPNNVKWDTCHTSRAIPQCLNSPLNDCNISCERKSKMIGDPVRDDANVLAVSTYTGLKQDLVSFLEIAVFFFKFLLAFSPFTFYGRLRCAIDWQCPR